MGLVELTRAHRLEWERRQDRTERRQAIRDWLLGAVLGAFVTLATVSTCAPLTASVRRDTIPIMDNAVRKYEFATYDDAWRFMLRCDETGHFAGFPDDHAPYSVSVSERPSAEEPPVEEL